MCLKIPEIKLSVVSVKNVLRVLLKVVGSILNAIISASAVRPHFKAASIAP